MLAVVCPGQGSQAPGLLNPWLELPGSEEFLAEASAAAGLDLVAHGTTSDADTIRDTAIAQPLIVATSLLSLRAVLDDRGVVSVTAGHSVGEFTAAAVAGVLDDVAAVGLVSRRAQAMARAAAQRPTGMSAVVGGDAAEVAAAIAAHGLHAANRNGNGQVVAAGALPALAELAAQPPLRARVVPLQVAGAFHTPYMDAAATEFAEVAREWPAADPRIPLLSNADGASYAAPGTAHGRGSDVLERLAAQIITSVRWDLCQEELARRGVRALLELAPAGVLTGLARRNLPGVETLALAPDNLDAARDLIRNHGEGV